MDKFLTIDFIVLLILAFVLLGIHELGHWLAYRLCGYDAVIRKSIFVPGIDPKKDIKVNKMQGLFIALNGFLFSALIEIVPLIFMEYKLWKALLLGSIAGASVDFIWAISMLFKKEIYIYARKSKERD